MKNIFLVFIVFFLLTIFFRFVIGNPVDSSRMQTKYKFISIPVFLNVLLFWNKSKKPVSIHVILYQMLNYILFLTFVIIAYSYNQNSFSKLYFNIECICGFIIIIALFIETIINLFRGYKWMNSDNSIIIDFENYTVTFKENNKLYVVHFANFINNKVYFYYDDIIVGEGSLDYKSKKLFIKSIKINSYSFNFNKNIQLFSFNNTDNKF